MIFLKFPLAFPGALFEAYIHAENWKDPHSVEEFLRVLSFGAEARQSHWKGFVIPNFLTVAQFCSHIKTTRFIWVQKRMLGNPWKRRPRLAATISLDLCYYSSEMQIVMWTIL